jgi:hypothetical protein
MVLAAAGQSGFVRMAWRKHQGAICLGTITESATQRHARGRLAAAEATLQAVTFVCIW